MVGAGSGTRTEWGANWLDDSEKMEAWEAGVSYLPRMLIVEKFNFVKNETEEAKAEAVQLDRRLAADAEGSRMSGGRVEREACSE